MRILLINSHAYDIRLPWSQWHQPTGLLQLGAMLKRQGCDVRFIDCLGWHPKQRTMKRKIRKIEVENYEIDLWRFGGEWSELSRQIKSYQSEGWVPDQVYVSCSTTIWWEAARDLITYLKTKWFPKSEVLLGGVYPTLEPEHARLHTNADRIVTGSIPDARNEIPDFGLYTPDRRPRFAGIYLYASQNVLEVEAGEQVFPRPPETIAQEIADKAALGVTEFAFFDHEIRLDQREHFIQVLRAVAALELDVRFIAIANISPQLIDGEVAQWMKAARYRQVYLKCDVAYNSEGAIYTTPLEAYREGVEALQREVGFKPRTGDVTAMLLVGNPYENLEGVTERLVKLASIVGAVNLVQYQYSSGTIAGELYASLIHRGNGNLDLTRLNCKFYPLAQLSGIPFEHYLELTRLAALLNSKYRSKTFDFLGDNLVAQAIQESLRDEGWNPFKHSTPYSQAEIIPLIPVQRSKTNDNQE